MLEQNQDLNPNLNLMPVTDNTVSIEQVAILEPKRKWWLIILISIFGILIIGVGLYVFLNKPDEKVVNEVVNTELAVENEVATSTIDENLDTDSDGLRDVDEINIWKTDINNADSDGDTYSDGDEVKNGYNPLGEGKLIQDNTTVDSSVIQGLLDSLAKSINEQNGQAFLDILSPNNDMYDRVQADSVKFVATFHTYFQKKIFLLFY